MTCSRVLLPLNDLYLCVPSLQQGDAELNALLEHAVVLGVDDEVDDELRGPHAVEQALDLHHAAPRLVRV